ncbi:methyltransferase domain-containing protein, partial [candidate division GN15 bacterium]|nr:methyltransferase domain-containing protein [candidate division GN15 bacterium]
MPAAAYTSGLRTNMHRDFENIFVEPESKEPLAYHGDVDGDRWTNGLLKSDGGKQIEVVDGSPLFAGIDKDPWGSDQKVADYFAKLGRQPSQVVRGSYEQATAGGGQRQQLAEEIDQILEVDGPIVEVNCGHGGGIAPLLLQDKPALPLILADLGRWLLHEWRDLAREQSWPKVSCAQISAEQLPFADESIGAITSMGGYANAGVDSPALREVSRVLRPGGYLLMLDARPDPSSFRRFPHDIRDELKEHYPAFGTGYPKLIKALGFSGGSYIETGRRPLG